MSAAGPDQPDSPPSPDDQTHDAHRDSGPTSVSRGPGQTIHIDGYEIISEIARGGMGVVFKARDKKLDRVVALKVMIAGEHASEDHIKRFLIEARAAAKLKHPNIVPIFEVGEQAGLHYFTMEFVEGQDLSDLIKQSPLNPSQTVNILEKVAGAVHYAHTQGIIHRDLKPSNILIDERGEPRVADFGLARDVEGGSDLTQSGQLVGTPSYMSPEQAGGEKLDPRSDVYSLGVVAYEMLCGEVPFQADNLPGLLVKITIDDPPVLRQKVPGMDRDLETITMLCLEKDPARRYRTAQALHEDLQHFAKGEAITARPASVLYRMRKKVAKHKGAAIGIAAVLLALVIGIIGYVVVRTEQARSKASWELVFEDDFERTELGEDWEVQKGQWKIEDGALVCERGVEFTILAPGTTSGAVRLEYNAWVPEGQQKRELSCVLNVTNSEEQSQYHFKYKADQIVCLKEAGSGYFPGRDRDLFQRYGRFIEPGRRYRFRMEFVDGWISAWVNNQPIFTRRDLFPLEGERRIGLYSYLAGAHFDDVHVSFRRSAELVPALSGGDALYRAGEFRKAAPEYARLARELRGSLAEEARLKEGFAWLAFVRAGKKKQTSDPEIQQYEQPLTVAKRAFNAIRHGSFRAQATMGLAQIAVERGQVHKAAGIIHAAVVRDPKDEEAEELRAWPIAAAQELISMFKWEDAIILYECAARLPGQDDFSAASALRHIGDLQVFLGRYEKAIEYFDEVKRHYSHVTRVAAWAGVHKANCYAPLKKYGQALAEFAKVEKDYPNWRGPCAAARRHRANVLRVMGRYDEALDMFASVGRDYPDQTGECVAARTWQGLTLLSMGRLVESRRKLESVERDFTKNRHAQFFLGTVLHASGNLDDAVEVWVSLAKDFPRQHSLCARSLALAGGYTSDKEKSRKLLRLAAKYTDVPESAAALYLLNEIDQKEFEKRTMLRFNDPAIAAFWNGVKSLREGRRDDAIGHFKKAIKLTIPGVTWPLLEARQCLKELGVEIEWPKPAKAE